ncbi:MAG: redoxin domain-containing protein, partial [Proteobacteria bacterium]|nr:redoxin domain-containing protein [Pseudomonadota bacterium]
MELISDEGLTTACGPLLMRLVTDEDSPELEGSFSADGWGGTSVPLLSVRASEDLLWQRSYPEPQTGHGFGSSPGECHGGTVDGSPDVWPGYLSFSLNSHESNFIWHFDYYWVDGNIVREHFTMTSSETPVTWIPTSEGGLTTEIVADFEFGWFLGVDGEPIHLYEAFDGSPRPFGFRLTVIPRPEIAVESFRAEPMDSMAIEFGRTWNTVAQRVGVPGVVVDAGTAERKGDGALLTTWTLMSDTVTGRLTHEASRGGGLLDVGLWPESGYDTEAGQLWLDDATRVLIQVMEPLLSGSEVEDLAARLLALSFGYEESDRTVFIYQAEDLSPFVLAAPMNPTSLNATAPEYGDPTIQGQALPLMPLSTTVDTSASGLAAPEVIGQNFSGEEVRMVDDGRAKAIVFLAHWCPHCQVEVPKVQAWIDRGGGVDGVDIYAVATGILPDRGNFPPSEWLETEGWSTPVLIDDTNNSVWTAYGQGGFPFWTFVNADGRVALRKSGEMPIEQLEEI